MLQDGRTLDVAELVLSLGMFEDYSAKCRNKDDADAAIHRMLYEETARARAIMEEALTKLCRHEQIDVDRIGSDIQQPRTGTTGLARGR